MKAIYPPFVTWSMLAIFALAFIFLIIGSPVHREKDPLFWFMSLNVLGLIFLSIILHHEKSEEQREGVIRAFFLADWMLGIIMAAYIIWKSARAGTLW